MATTRRDGEDAGPDDPSESPSHLLDVEDGCGCVEVWEHLSEAREEGSTD